MGKTDDAIREIKRRKYTFQQFTEYLHTLPKGIPARVVGRMLDNAGHVDYTKRCQEAVIRGLERLSRLEQLEDDPFSPFPGQRFY